MKSSLTSCRRTHLGHLLLTRDFLHSKEVDGETQSLGMEFSLKPLMRNSTKAGSDRFWRTVAGILMGVDSFT